MSRHLLAVTAPVAEDLAAQDDALDVQCPLCHAERDGYCTNALTGQHLKNRTSHWQRIREAQSGARTQEKT